MYDTNTGALVFEHKVKRNICKVFEDQKGNRRIITTANVGPETEMNKKIKAATYDPKQSSFFHGKFAPIIARIPMTVFSMLPAEIINDDKAFERYLDQHPEWKAVDVGWTRPMLKRGGFVNGVDLEKTP